MPSATGSKLPPGRSSRHSACLPMQTCASTTWAVPCRTIRRSKPAGSASACRSQVSSVFPCSRRERSPRFSTQSSWARIGPSTPDSGDAKTATGGISCLWSFFAQQKIVCRANGHPPKPEYCRKGEGGWSAHVSLAGTMAEITLYNPEHRVDTLQDIVRVMRRLDEIVGHAKFLCVLAIRLGLQVCQNDNLRMRGIGVVAHPLQNIKTDRMIVGNKLLTWPDRNHEIKQNEMRLVLLDELNR